MKNILVFSDNFELSKELLALAGQMGVSVFAVHLNEEEAKELVLFGAEKVFVLKGSNSWPESYAVPIVDIIKNEQPTMAFIGATVRGRDIAARISTMLRCGLISDALSVQIGASGFEVERMMFGGAVVQTEILEGFGVITIPLNRYQAKRDDARKGEIIVKEVVTDDRISVVETIAATKEDTGLAKADKVICVGLGIDKKEDIKMAYDLASTLGGSVGCTRPIAEDKGWLPVSNYIGISGLILKPELYVALGVSGQVQHMVGVREAKVVVAINNNEKAPIFQNADYGIVGDIYEAVPLLIKELGS